MGTENPTLALDGTTPQFWRDQAFPHFEARSISDGRQVCYAKHAHETFSIGVITGGHSTYLNRASEKRVAAGSVVVINPGDVHACNPIGNQPWAYRMLYVETAWLGALQHQLGFSPNRGFHEFAPTVSREPALYAGFNRCYELLTAPGAEPLAKEVEALRFFMQLQQGLNAAPYPSKVQPAKLQRAADFIRENCARSLKLEEISQAANISASYLIRSFKQGYGMTPHVYLLNRRIELARSRLKRGEAIAAVALELGFADQAHFQRVFKQWLAATPGQYRG